MTFPFLSTGGNLDTSSPSSKMITVGNCFENPVVLIPYFLEMAGFLSTLTDKNLRLSVV